MTLLSILIGLVLVVLNGAFVAVEFGILGAKRGRIDELARTGDRAGVAAQRLQADVLEGLGGAQLGITICSLILGRLAEPAVAHLIEDAIDGFVEISDTLLHTIGFAVALSIVVVIHMVLGEMVPKNLALATPERVLLALSRPFWAYLRLARPINGLLQLVANGLLRLLRVQPKSEVAEVATTAEFELMVRESHQEGLIDTEERALIEGALRFGEASAADVMAPIDEVDAVADGDLVSTIEERLDATGHTRLIVFGDNADDVRGFVHSKDLLALGVAARDAPLTAQLVRPMLRVEPHSPLPEVLQLMRRSRIHLALVTEDGISRGVLTLDDVLRGLVGSLVAPGAGGDNSSGAVEPPASG